MSSILLQCVHAAPDAGLQAVAARPPSRHQRLTKLGQYNAVSAGSCRLTEHCEVGARVFHYHPSNLKPSWPWSWPIFRRKSTQAHAFQPLSCLAAGMQSYLDQKIPHGMVVSGWAGKGPLAWTAVLLSLCTCRHALVLSIWCPLSPA